MPTATAKKTEKNSSKILKERIFLQLRKQKKVKTNNISESVDKKPEEGLGNRLSFVLDDLESSIAKLEELETSSEENGKIGIGTIRESKGKLEKLREDIKREIEKLRNNFPEIQ